MGIPYPKPFPFQPLIYLVETKSGIIVSDRKTIRMTDGETGEYGNPLEHAPHWTHRTGVFTMQEHPLVPAVGCPVMKPISPLNPIFPGRFALTLLLCLSLGLVACADNDGNGAENDEAESGEAQTPIAAAEVTARNLSREVRMSATVESRVTIDLASRASGRVEQLFVEEGDAVEAGQHLATLDMSEEEAELERARATAEEARLEYERTAQLLEQGDIARAEYERVQAQRRAADSQVLLWETRLAFGQVRAPRDAVVSQRRIHPGEAVSNQDPLFELVDMTTLVLRLGVSELDVVHLEAGQTVPVRFDARPDREMDGEIRRIFPTAQDGSRLITVEVALPDGAYEQGIRPGFLGRVAIPLDERPDALAVPSSAIGEAGDERYVYVVENETLVRRTVELGVDRGEWTEVLSGVESGEIVLATNPIDMREGQAVRIVGWRG